jgi:hypothetical protein
VWNSDRVFQNGVAGDLLECETTTITWAAELTVIFPPFDDVLFMGLAIRMV